MRRREMCFSKAGEKGSCLHRHGKAGRKSKAFLGCDLCLHGEDYLPHLHSPVRSWMKVGQVDFNEMTLGW